MESVKEKKYEETLTLQYDIKQGYNIVIRPLENGILLKQGTVLKKAENGLLDLYTGASGEQIYGVALKAINNTNNDFIAVFVRGVLNAGVVAEEHEDALEKVGIYIR